MVQNTLLLIFRTVLIFIMSWILRKFYENYFIYQFMTLCVFGVVDVLGRIHGIGD